MFRYSVSVVQLDEIDLVLVSDQDIIRCEFGDVFYFVVNFSDVLIVLLFKKEFGLGGGLVSLYALGLWIDICCL